jgi:hypothetical protein
MLVPTKEAGVHSVDLRRRVVGAIEGDCRVERRHRDLRQRVERDPVAHAELILSALAAKSDITLAELRERLRERGVTIGTLWRFFKAYTNGFSG